MSSRQLRRLGKDDLEATLLKITSKSPSPNADESPNTKSVPASSNLFMLMNEGEDEEDEEDEEEAPEAAASDSEPVATPVKQNTLEIKSRSQKKKSKKKNRNQSKKGTKQSQAGNSNPDDSEPKDDDEEFDKIIQQFQKSHVKAFRHADSDDEGFTTADEEVSDAEGTENSWAKLFDLRQDSGFTKFKYFKQLNELFADFDFKNLVPDNEFKLLFDDLSPETLQDIDSVTSTHVSPEVMKQIDRMKRLVKNWSGKDKRSVPNGGTVRKLQFTKIRDDWLPTIRGELSLKRLGNEELVKWLRWERPLDWDAVIKSDVEHKWTKHFNYYKFEPLNDANSKKALTEFYLSAVLSPDHEALISLISSHFPYHVPGLLQVALICVRQGDKSNSNGLVERALFVFDRCLKNGIEFNAKDFQLPYIYFYNRQFYLALMRYIQIVSQRGAISTAAQLCKTLLSLSPLEDPLGVRYFIDHYLATNNEYLYLIKLVKSPLSNLYRQWFTLGIGLTGVYAYLQLDCADDARILLERVWISYPHSLCKVFTDFLLGDISKLPKDIAKPSTSVLIETKAYTTRMSAVWKDHKSKEFLHDELIRIFQISPIPPDAAETTAELDSPFFIDDIPINLLRFAILSQESSVMAAIPDKIWSSQSVYEFDVLPPQPYDRDTEDIVETIESLVDKKQLELSQMEHFADQELLQRINQISLQEYLAQHENQQGE